MILRGAAIFGAMLLLAGCQVAPSQNHAYVPAPGGLMLLDSGLEVSLGRAETGARAAIVKLAGPERAVRDIAGCGRVVDSADGLASTYRGGRFTGWQKDGQSAGDICA